MLRSTQCQLRDFREATDSGFACVHVDTCLPDYLNDHHNRDGELLLGVAVNGLTTVGDVKNELLSEFASIGWDLAGDKPGFDYDKAKAAILASFVDVHPMTLDRGLFDESLDAPNEEEDDFTDSCYAYFVITWEVPDEDD